MGKFRERAMTVVLCKTLCCIVSVEAVCVGGVARSVGSLSMVSAGTVSCVDVCVSCLFGVSFEEEPSLVRACRGSRAEVRFHDMSLSVERGDEVVAGMFAPILCEMFRPTRCDTFRVCVRLIGVSDCETLDTG